MQAISTHKFAGRAASLLTAFVLLGAAPDYRSAARGLDAVILQKYAYLEKLPGRTLPRSGKLDAERDRVADRTSLLRYAEHRVASLADHHAITGSSFSDDWAIVPTYADLWIVKRGGAYVIDAVRADSPSAAAGIKRGDRLASIGGTETASAVAAFWSDLGLTGTQRRDAYAARVLAAGRRDRDRELGIQGNGGAVRTVALPSLYRNAPEEPALSVSVSHGETSLRFNNSLGDDATISSFDTAMSTIPPANRLILDLRNTPSGGNTVVARAIMGWFVDRARNYQVHNRPEEERSTGIPHQWVEQVLPRPGKHRDQLPNVLVGRWTGSMGEGLAIGFAALGASVRGDAMAGLNGSVEDIALGDTGITVKLPTERLMTVWGLPREDFVPEAMR